MATRRAFSELDAYLARLAGEAGAASLARAIALTRRLSPTALQSRLLVALQRGEAPATLAELEHWVATTRARWPKLVRAPRQLAAPARQRQRGSGERMFAAEDVARELGVPGDAVAAWCRQGLLKSEPGEAGPRIPDSALYAYRAALPRWKRVEALAAATRDGEPAPAEDAIYAAVAARRGA